MLGVYRNQGGLLVSCHPHTISEAELQASRAECSKHEEAQAQARALHASVAGRVEQELGALRAGMAQLAEERPTHCKNRIPSKGKTTTSGKIVHVSLVLFVCVS